MGKPSFWKMTFRSKLMVGVVSAVLLPLSMAGLIIYAGLSKSLETRAREKSYQIAMGIAAGLESTFSEEMKYASTIASDPSIVKSVFEKNYTEAFSHLKPLFENTKMNYITFLITDSSGALRVDVSNGKTLPYSFADRDYFLKAKGGIVAVSGPRISMFSGKEIVTVSAPIKRWGAFIGMIVLVISVDAVIERIDSIKAGKTGYAFLQHTDGTLLVHPMRELMFKLNMYHEPGLEELSRRIGNREKGTAVYSFRGIKKVAGFYPVNIAGWYVVFTQNRDEFMMPVKRTILYVFITGSVSVVMALILIIVISRRISNPVERRMEELKQITERSEELIIGIGLDRKIIFANPSAVELLGKEEKDLVGTIPVLSDLSGIDSEDIWRDIEKGIPWSGRIMPDSDRRDGLVLSVAIVAIKDEKENIQSYIEIGRNITSEIARERKMQQEQKIEAIGTLAGGIAHDFNNILSGIFGYSELSLAVKNNPPATERYLRGILKAAERARDLVNQILVFSRGGKEELKLISPGPVIMEIIKFLRASTPAMIEIESDINSDSMIMADPVQLHQVLVNLCTNAVYSIGNNSGRIKIDLEDFYAGEEFCVTHPGVNPGNYVLLRVSDTGSGIKNEIKDRIFDPFFTTKGKGEGTGLGLSVVHGIINNLGGIITVYSEERRGTVFTILIPVSAGSQIEREDEVPFKAGNGGRIILVDDEEVIIDSVQKLLTDSGYFVRAFTDGIMALDEIIGMNGDYDIIVTDYSMPKINGIDLVVKIRETGFNIPVIMTSGFIDQAMEERAVKHGIERLIKKPFNSSQIIDVIESILARRDYNI